MLVRSKRMRVARLGMEIRDGDPNRNGLITGQLLPVDGNRWLSHECSPFVVDQMRQRRVKTRYIRQIDATPVPMSRLAVLPYESAAGRS